MGSSGGSGTIETSWPSVTNDTTAAERLSSVSASFRTVE